MGRGTAQGVDAAFKISDLSNQRRRQGFHHQGRRRLVLLQNGRFRLHRLCVLVLPPLQTVHIPRAKRRSAQACIDQAPTQCYRQKEQSGLCLTPPCRPIHGKMEARETSGGGVMSPAIASISPAPAAAASRALYDGISQHETETRGRRTGTRARYTPDALFRRFVHGNRTAERQRPIIADQSQPPEDPGDAGIYDRSAGGSPSLRRRLHLVFRPVSLPLSPVSRLPPACRNTAGQPRPPVD